GSSPNDVWFSVNTSPSDAAWGWAFEMIHWDGVAFSEHSEGLGLRMITSISSSGPNDAWVVDSEHSAYHWDGIRWSHVAPPPGITRRAPRSAGALTLSFRTAILGRKLHQAGC